MAPFRSKSQERAAFAGYLGSEMKAKAPTWAHETGQGGDSGNPKGSKASARAFNNLPDQVKRHKKLAIIKRKAQS